MNKFLFTMAAVSGLAVGTPAAAQYANGNQQNGYQNNGYQNGGYANGDLSARIGQLNSRLEAGIRSGAISRREAMPLRQQLRQLSQLERQYSVNGTSGRERADLQQRVQYLRQQIRAADNQSRWDGYDREDGYGQSDRDGYDRNAQYDRNDRLDRNNDGYDDRDYNRDGRRDDYANNGQPSRGGIEGVMDALLGTSSLRVGQQAPVNLYGVPVEYRGQYQDGNGAYYRTDGRQIYQIDTRTRMVTRIYAMNR